MIKLDEKETIIFEKMLIDLGAERQFLDKDSEKPLVYHKEHKQLSFVVSGKGYGQAGNEVYNLERGNMMLLDENTYHSFLCTEGKLELLHLHFPIIQDDEDRFIKENICENWKKII